MIIDFYLYIAVMITKRCTRCCKRKAVSAFHKNKRWADGYDYWCKSCRAAYSKEHYQRNKKMYVAKARRWGVKNRPLVKQLVDTFKKDGCKICGEMTACCLQAHHRDASEKTESIGNMISDSHSFGTTRVIAELAKCVCLCANCHCKVHAGLVTLL